MWFKFRGGGSGGGGGTPPVGGDAAIGIPSDGTYNDGLYHWQATHHINDALDDLNEALKYLVPEPPEPLEGDFVYSVPLYSGYIAQHSNNGSLTAGSYHTLIVDTNTFTMTTIDSTHFSDADKGSLVVYLNDSQIDTFDLAGHFNESERDGCQSYPPSTSTGGYITVLSVCKYNNFPAYQKGQARINATSSLISVGYNKVQLQHQVTGSDIRSTNPQEIYYDDGPAPTISGLNVTLVSEVIKWLSGVKYYASNTEFSFVFDVSDLFNKTYIATPVTITCPAMVTRTLAWNDSNASGYSNPPNWNDGWHYNANHVLDNPAAGDTLTFTVQASRPMVTSAPATHTLNNTLYNTYGNISTDKHEYFVDENYRLPAGSWDSPPASLTGNWDSTQALTNGNAQVYIDRLVYPHIDFTSGYSPNQTADYSSFSGDQEYYRAIHDSAPHSSGSLHLRGITQSDLGSNVDVYIKLPGKTGWLDLSQPYNAATFTGSDGDGAYTSISQSGDVLIINWTAGTYSTSQSNYMYILKIVLHNTSVEIGEVWDFGG